jgi:hypothetical protein
MNHNMFAELSQEDDGDAIMPRPQAPTARRRTVCGHCGENHRTSTHDKCIAEGRPLPNQPRRPAGQPIQRGRPVQAANPTQAAHIRGAALLGENDEEGEDDNDGQLPDLQHDQIDSDDDDDEDEGIPGGHWQEIVAEQPLNFANQRELHHNGGGLFEDDDQQIPRFLGETDQGPNYGNIKRKLRENFIANGGDQREFRYRADTICKPLGKVTTFILLHGWIRNQCICCQQFLARYLHAFDK